MSKFIRPFVVSGRPPPLTSVQVRPASVDFQSAEAGPPLLRKYGPRARSQLAAHTTSGLLGSSCTSTNPALSLTNFTSSQVVPPFVLLYNPRSRFGPHVWPSAAT